ncbi:transcription factor Opi1-domain-containing protein [Syncephalis plumigaleata]|nr:transcription factor Opi1-domain-containing protein [Syncephalis plumigaleata]
MEGVESSDNRSTYRSRMSITELCNSSVHSEDVANGQLDDTMDTDDVAIVTGDAASIYDNPTTEEEMAAIAALGNLRRGEPTMYAEEDKTDTPDVPIVNGEDFISRVANIPLVKSTIRFYDKSKANSRVVKYGAEMMESSMKTISQPVLNRLEPRLGQLDEFACRQLDKFQGSNSTVVVNRDGDTAYSTDVYTDEVTGNNELRHRSTANTQQSDHEMSAQQTTDNQMAVTSTGNNSIVAAERTPQRSRWQKLLVEASTAAGAGAAALSEEGMRSLKYCLEWLSYAVRHIEHQIYLLRSFIASITDGVSESQNANQEATPSNAVVHPNTNTLATIKREVVETLRKVVEVIGRYAGACLPREARSTVRSFILGLPSRWASLNSDLSAVSSMVSSPCQSPLLTPTTPPSMMLPGSHPQLTPTDSANRVLALATESLLMLKSVADVFGETKDRAEVLVDRLRSMGYSPAGDIDPYGHSTQLSPEMLASRLQAVAQQSEYAQQETNVTGHFSTEAQPNYYNGSDATTATATIPTHGAAQMEL